MSPRARGGFTLIEVLAAVFLTAVVMTVAIAFFVDLSDSTDAAALKARRGRMALAVTDRIARDLEGAFLIAKPPELDPLLHPWFFIAQDQYGDPGADRLRFITRNHRPRNPLGHGSDVAVVTYLLHPAEDAPGFELLRAVVPGLPQEFEVEFLPAQDERFMVVAQNIDHFALRFMGEDYEWFDVWDSTQLEQSSLLPVAADIEVSFLEEVPEDAEAFGEFGLAATEEEAPLPYVRRITLPVRPIDLQAMLAEAAKAATGQGQGQDEETEEGEPGEDEEGIGEPIDEEDLRDEAGTRDEPRDDLRFGGSR